MEIELRRAIAQDGLSMVYQPIVNVADGSMSVVGPRPTLRYQVVGAANGAGPGVRLKTQGRVKPR